MISYIIASHHWPTLRDNLGATIRGIDDDEVHVVENATSIAAAYNEGQSRATQPIRCYVHHDVRILDAPRLREQLLKWCQPWMGMVGLVGSRDAKVPWWTGAQCGSVLDARVGRIGSGLGGECVFLDGLLLATAQTVVWDESYPGWHGYDHDVCRQFVQLGAPNWCIDNGHELVLHNTTGSSDPDEIDGFNEAMARFGEKWGGQDRSG